MFGLKSWCSGKGYKVVTEFIEAGASGGNERPHQVIGAVDAGLGRKGEPGFVFDGLVDFELDHDAVDANLWDAGGRRRW